MRVLVLIFTCAGFGILPAAAHVSITHSFSFGTGLAHPFSGLDHIAAMMAVGLWAAVIGGTRLWVWPAAFFLAMLGGAALGHQGVIIPHAEPAIAASVMILGLAIATMARLPASAGTLLIASFGIVHGYAHGLEAPATGWTGYAVGFLSATAVLLVAGAVLGRWLSKPSEGAGARVMGAVTMIIGFLILVQQ